ncbi:MAG: hypothetical protein H8D39_04155 [Candidatus Atribacteria bacterium]|nr:hypothetical protein [Candidatus Atribacteria bacterium]
MLSFLSKIPIKRKYRVYSIKYRVKTVSGIEYIVSSKERKRKERSKIILYSIELRKIKVDCVDELKMEKI